MPGGDRIKARTTHHQTAINMNTINDAILKCNKKAWPEIKAIKNAPDMNCVEQLIDQALGKTFGMWNKGLLKCQMLKLGQMGEFERLMVGRRGNWDKYVGDVRRYLIDFIPVRLHKSLMYQRLIGRI